MTPISSGGANRSTICKKQSEKGGLGTYLFVVDLNVTDSDGDGLVEFLASLVVQLLDGSWDDASLLEVVGQTKHRVGLATACLPVAHNRAVVALGYALDQLIGGDVVHIILGGIMKNAGEFEFPGVRSVVNDALVLLLLVDFEVLNSSVSHHDQLTPVFTLSFKLVLANLSVGLVLIMTLTACFDI